MALTVGRKVWRYMARQHRSDDTGHGDTGQEGEPDKSNAMLVNFSNSDGFVSNFDIHLQASPYVNLRDGIPSISPRAPTREVHCDWVCMFDQDSGWTTTCQLGMVMDWNDTSCSIIHHRHQNLNLQSTAARPSRPVTVMPLRTKP